MLDSLGAPSYNGNQLNICVESDLSPKNHNVEEMATFALAIVNRFIISSVIKYGLECLWKIVI